ncbi:PREDICTED: uncharacterized protein LOC106126407 isoform X2 [Papilio xuthus]|uniref:Uncharacterized protein LOC106126407 isoform X2 n=1 Tax=Papilio xuthus TaxID=66420 RepID=A0AAJ6ZUY1_PAPXU|nr:PREDICTED: uncharacterized protein LOC106126407 isoform X2 [Papilio xuthus]
MNSISGRNDKPILELSSLLRFITDGSCDECEKNNDLQMFVTVSKTIDANRMSIKRSMQLPKTFRIIKLSPISKLISKRYRYSILRHKCIILFQCVVKKKKVNIFIFFPYKSKVEINSQEIKIRRYLLSITCTNDDKISKIFETHIYYVLRKVEDQFRRDTLQTNCANNIAMIKKRLIKDSVNKISHRTPTSEMYILKESKSSSNLSKHLQLCNNSLTKMRSNANLLEMRNSSLPLSGNEEFYLVKRIQLVYIMSKSRKCPHYPTCSKKMFHSKKSHCVSNIFEQSCKLHNELLKKTAMPCCKNHKDNMNTVMDSMIKKRRCIEKEYEHMLRQISKLMHTCNDEKSKLRVTSKHCYPKKPKCKKEILPLCQNCKQNLKEKPKNICKPKCMDNFGKIIKSTYDRCSKQAKTKLKNNNIGKIIKDTYGQCSKQAKMKCKTIHLDKIIKKLYGQCSQQVTSKVITKLKPTKQDCYMFSVHAFPNQKLVSEPEMCHFKKNAVFQFMSIMNQEQSKVVNCAAMSKRDSIIENDTSTLGLQQRNYLKSKLLLVKKRTSVVFLDVNNFAEYDICLQGMFKDTDEPKCMLGDNHDNELSNECKNKLCNAKTSPIKVKLPLPKCIDCTRDNKQCDMGLNTLPQYIEEEYKPVINSKTPRIIRRQKITPSFSPDCIIEINNNGKDLESLELIDNVQQIKNRKCQEKTDKKPHPPFWVKLFQKITKKRNNTKKKICKTDSKELYKCFLEEDYKNCNNILTYSDFKKMNEQQLLDIICELKKATFCNSPHDSIQDVETSSKSLSSDSYIGKDMDETEYNLSRYCRHKYKNKRNVTTKVSQKFKAPELLNKNSRTKHLIPKRKVFTSNYSQCEKVSSKSVKNIYWRCATKDGKKKKKRNKLTKVKKPRILKQQIIKCHLSSHRGMTFKHAEEQPECIRNVDNCGKNLTSVHSIECIQSLTDYEKIENHRPFWFKKRPKIKTKKNQQSQACETDIEEQCELILEEHNAEADELTFSVFEISTEKQLRHVIYDLESATSSYHSSLRRKESSQTCVALGSDEPCNLILSEDVELTFSDFETMDENQLHDIICQLQNAMLSCDSNPHRPSFEINEKHCDDGLTFGDFQRMSIKQLKDIISEIEAMNSDCDTSTALEVEASSDTESINTSCMSDEVQESVSSAVYSLSTYTSDAESNHAGFSFLIRPNNTNLHKFFRIFRIK